MPFAIGEAVGPYRIVEKLGQGGMATVFKAYHPALDRYVALKVLHPAFREDPQFLARFQREARIVAKLDHPNIVPIYDFAEHRGHPYLVMRFIEGETLKARLRKGPLSLDEVWRVMRAVGDALSYAHKRGVLHRDIKPSNVILTPEGHVYLTDFGLARMAQAGESTLSRDMMVGTPQYISPEQAKGETNLDARIDIYSLGVVLYELLVGRVPFQGDTPYAVIHDHIFTPLPMPRDLKPDLPESLERVLLKALAKDPDDRFQTVNEMVKAFEAALQTASTVAESLPETIVAPRPPEPSAKAEAKRRVRPWVWALVGVAAILCAVGLWTVLAGYERGQAEPAVRTPFPSPPPGTVADPGQRWLENARAARDQGEIVRACMLYRRARDADPTLEAAYLEAGDMLLKIGDVERLLQNYLDGVAALPDSVELRRRLAETAVLVGATEIVDEQIAWLFQEVPDDPLIPACTGMVELAEGSCETALPQFEQALAADPTMPLALYGRGLCALIEGDTEGAREDLEAILHRQEAPPLLQMSAEIWLDVLDLGMVETVRQGVERMRGLLAYMPPGERETRATMAAHIDQAWNEWQNGQTEVALRELGDARGVLVGRWQEIGGRLALDLGRELARLTFIMGMLSPLQEEPPQTGDVWERLYTMAADVPEEDGLRDGYKEMTDQAFLAWERGDVGRAIQALKALSTWVEEHREALGDPLADALTADIDQPIESLITP